MDKESVLSRYVNVSDGPAEQNVAQKHHGGPPAVTNFRELRMNTAKQGILSEDHKIRYDAV